MTVIALVHRGSRSNATRNVPARQELAHEL